MSFFTEVLEALQAAEEAKRAVKAYRDRMLKLLAGDLRGGDTYYLKKIKRELESFDARTGVWK
jgi:hypothetical protein